jgi:pimeloyl-ACP methyl ester carboxylesterase
MTLPFRSHIAVLAVAAVALVPILSGCGSESTALQQAEREQSNDRDVAFQGCDEVACTGEIGGAAYEIALPEKWNGTLLLYSHGYRQAEAAPPDFEAPSTAAEPAPGWSGGQKEVGQALLDQGYALAGSAYASNGWAVAEGIEAGEKLHNFFVDKVGEPDRTYVWGDSLGGLVTEVLAERNPDWVSGAAPFCGVLAGPVLNLDLALDVAYSVKTLLYPELKLTGFASWEEAVRNWEGAYSAILAAGSDVSTGVPKILVTAALVDAPTKTKTYDGSTIESQVRARAEALLTAVGYATFGRYDIEQRFGGNPSGNDAVDYATRISPEERDLIETVSKGSTNRLLAQLADGERVSADEAAREAFAASGTPSGVVQDPTLTLHTAADPLVLAQNETVFADRAYAAKGRTGDFVQLYTLPPASYSTETGAPSGAGHCNFTEEQRTGAISLLDGWVREGRVPGAAAITEAFAGDESVSQTFSPGPWPVANEE